MSSLWRDVLNKLVQDHPDLPIRLLREIGGIELPAEPLTVGYGDVRDRVSREMHANIVLFGGPRQNRWFSVIVEVEAKMSEHKLRQTLTAAEILHLETRRPVHVVVITPDPDAVRFYRRVEASSGCLTILMRPLIVGSHNIPVLTDPQAMADDVLMAALSVMAHGRRHQEAVETFAKLLDDLPADNTTSLLRDFLRGVRRLLEEPANVYIPVHSPWAQNLYRKGFVTGFAERKAERLAAEAALSVLFILRFRDIEIPPAREQQISTCTDLAVLDTWLRRAPDAAHIDDLFDDTSEPETCPTGARPH
jgi:hypothetical protein